MTAREIGFPCRAWEVRAFLDGRKTQARRVVTPQPFQDPNGHGWQWHGGAALLTAGYGDRYVHTDEEAMRRAIVKTCPFGKPGDRLFVQETWGVGSRPDPWGGYDGIEYRADDLGPSDDEDLPCYKVKTPDDVCLSDYRHGWHSSTSMPRWASRITLEVVGLRAERLEDITEDDVIAEGVNGIAHGREGTFYSAFRDEPHPKNWVYPDDAFRELWDSTNAKRAPFSSNPWVWAITLRRIA